MRDAIFLAEADQAETARLRAALEAAGVRAELRAATDRSNERHRAIDGRDANIAASSATSTRSMVPMGKFAGSNGWITLFSTTTVAS